MDGVINGSTIRKKRADAPAPSMVAASVRLVGTLSRAAEKTSMLYPKPCQRDSRTTHGMAQVFDPRKFGAWTPNHVCISESIRPLGARISEKIAAFATTGVTTGMKKIVRYRPRGLIRGLIQTARLSEITMLSGTYRITKTNVLMSAVLNSELVSRFS